ncbi:MAG: hypothetical protein ABSF62_11915 [Bryobacteraceae bacterium]
MNIDERIEALTQTVELLAHMHQDLEKKWDQRFGKMLDIVERLDRVIQIHEERPNGHDRRPDDLEGRR